MSADANIKTIAEISQKRTFSPGSACGPHLIRRFAARAPPVTVDVQRMWLSTMTEALVSGRIDVAITCGLIPRSGRGGE